MSYHKQNMNAQNVGSSGKWSLFPVPQSNPITVRKAFRGLSDNSGIPFPDWLVKVCRERRANPSHSFNSAIMRKLFSKYRNGETGGSFSFHLLFWDRPSPTLLKSWISNGGLGHPTEDRYINLAELKRLSSFPDDFIFLGDFKKDQVARIGNSVPPLLMKEVALNLKKSPLLQEIDFPTVVSTFAGCGGSCC